jgi:hypothetical protein
VIPVEKQIRWTEADSEGLAKLMALDRFIGGDDDAFVDVIRENPDLKAALVGTDPLEPEPEDDEVEVFPTVWDRQRERTWWMFTRDAWSWTTAVVAAVLVIGAVVVLVHAAVTR